MQVDPQDYAWRDFDLFVQHGLVDESGALGVAARDARRRGPVWLFRLPAAGEGTIRGKAERHCVSFSSESPFPEPLRSRPHSWAGTGRCPSAPTGRASRMRSWAARSCGNSRRMRRS